MSRHRVKNISYDDDDFDDEVDADENELSPEDREQMKLRTVEVQQLLRSLIPPIEAKEDDIWEALWHYYYDVDKSVDYLKKKYQPQEKKEAKTKTPTAAAKKKNTAGSPVSSFPLPCSAHFCAHDFFKDSPWLNIPPHRKADILIEPLFPGLGLLGGSSSEKPGKMSKLAALAAARKRKESEKQKPQGDKGVSGSSLGTPEENAQEQGSKALSLRDRLAGVGRSRTSPTSRPIGTTMGGSGTPGNESLQTADSVRAASNVPEKAQIQHEKPALPEVTELLAADPSEFAATIIGEKRTPKATIPSSVPPDEYNLFNFVVQDLTEVYNFAEPSPDDIVIGAQNAAKEKKAKRNANQQVTGKAQGDLAGSVQQLSVETVKVKSKNLNVLEEHRKAKRKKAANFVVIGHVDAGKSTLMGRLLYDLKAVDQRTLDKYQREADKIGDIFRGGIQNPLSISGRIDAGHLQMGDQLLVMPSGEKTVVKSLEVDSEPVDWAVAGQNVVLHLADIDPKHLRIGDIVCSPISPAQNITSFTAKVLAFNHLTPMHIDVHRGRLHVPGRITQLVATLDKGSGKATKRRPKIVAPGNVARVLVELDQSIPLEAPARVVLRASGDTVAAGLLE
ncbi:translation elongation factor Tu [Arthroderma uncinatum]|uniref:translation elongation factor Tu n=1 Tax=Arthroderma uncinatum TaxID=74035 RepID=UPI00144ABC0D|nr:translation elongation factor Tu [Arthroderma uncinatum]KAF3492318.1 translation elongation factor Tu [Arthroderma uncinatum]